MEHEHQRGRRQRRLASRAGVLVFAAGLVAVTGTGLRPHDAGAAALEDASRSAAMEIAHQLAAVDASLRAAQGALPQADADLLAAAATAATAATADDAPSGADHLASPLRVGGGSVADSAAGAILGDLAPERAESAVVAADAAVVAAQARSDELHAALATATEQRAQLLHALEAGGHARTRWSVALFDRLGVPATVENVRALSAWIGAEANNSRFRNPLATTMGASGATNVNEVGVKSYPTDDIGLDATVRTLTNGLYEPILASLQAGDSATRVVTAVAASPWGTGENAVIRLRQDG